MLLGEVDTSSENDSQSVGTLTMSKAFTSEESEDTSVSGRMPTRARRGEERPITPDGHRALVETLTQLETVERPAARALPIEHERTEAVRRVEAKLALVQATLESVRVVAKVEPPDGVVRFGSEVTLTWDDGRTQTVWIVGPDEVDVKAGRVSIESPLARALIDATAGAVIEVERPRGTETATVERVS